MTEMVQIEVGVSAEGQLLVCAKSPLDAIDEIFRFALPALVSTTDCGAETVFCTTLPKDRPVGLNCARGPLPAPLKDADCAGALLVTLRDPVREPATVGRNPTVIVHVALTPSDDGQLLDCE